MREHLVDHGVPETAILKLESLFQGHAATVVWDVEGMEEHEGQLRLGARAGSECEPQNLFHEMAHLAEIDDKRVLKPGWGLKMPRVFIPGRYHRYVAEPKTMKALERELRVVAYQAELSEWLGTGDPTIEFASALRFMPDFWMVPRPYEIGEEKKIAWCVDRVIKYRRKHTLARFMAEWWRKSDVLIEQGKRIRRNRVRQEKERARELVEAGEVVAA